MISQATKAEAYRMFDVELFPPEDDFTADDYLVLVQEAIGSYLPLIRDDERRQEAERMYRNLENGLRELAAAQRYATT